jgi:hypothetical protein
VITVLVHPAGTQGSAESLPQAFCQQPDYHSERGGGAMPMTPPPTHICHRCGPIKEFAQPSLQRQFHSTKLRVTPPSRRPCDP